MRKFVLINVILILLSVSLSLAVCPGDPGCPVEPQSDPNKFNPNDPSSFDYTSGDYTTITDWSKVDWNKIPQNRIKDVPATSLDFSKLNSNQIGSLSTTQKQTVTATQIKDHLDKLGDLTKYTNSKAAIKDKYGVDVTSFSTSPEANVKVDQDGFLIADFGQGGNAPLTKLSKGTKVRIDNNGNVIVEGEAKPPQDGFYIAKYPIKKDPQTGQIEDAEIEIGGSKRKVRGELIVDGRDVYVEKFGAVVDGITIPPQDKVQIFFDGKKHQGNYISIGKNSMFIGNKIT